MILCNDGVRYCVIISQALIVRAKDLLRNYVAASLHIFNKCLSPPDTEQGYSFKIQMLIRVSSFGPFLVKRLCFLTRERASHTFAGPNAGQFKKERS